ncbi:hypothetical protein PR202_gb18457 [Eleusine coracana subsp. coracana]|uniref:MLO-like protein n=1 Tax=Eleusine coracana subsp. coracana TaxID=191504 RepID=A0AAV5F5F9_ELECO|nr:hypothetical protein PR202_gb18457 [Eleusine coracana subsp. coracana]
MAGGGGGRELPDTPTWAVAVVCAVIVLISFAMEYGLHWLGHWFHTRQKKALREALEKIKAELMLMGFISLLLAVGQTPISKICIPKKAGNIMKPCKAKADSSIKGDARRRLLWYLGQEAVHRRFLAAAGGEDECTKNDENMVALISAKGIHELHIFIFVLAVFHVTYSVSTMVLGRMKMKKWKKWEAETASLDYQFANDPSRFRFTHQTSFVRRHIGFSGTPGIRWIAHLAPNSKFDFHKYIKRSLETTSKSSWASGWGTLIWMSYVPVLILLMVGTKLEIVIMEMAKEIQDKASVIKGAPIVEPSNKFFWFNRPQWVLFFIHLTLFQNAFQMAHFIWTMFTPGLKDCFHENIGLSIMRIVVGLILQVICSYITFPLYALVTQMGTHMKKTIFEEQTANALMKWHNAAKEKSKHREAGYDGYMSGNTTPSRGMSPDSSPVHLLNKATGRSDDPQSVPASPMREQELGDMYPPVVEQNRPHRLERRAVSSSSIKVDINDSDFSFSTQK